MSDDTINSYKDKAMNSEISKTNNCGKIINGLSQK